MKLLKILILTFLLICLALIGVYLYARYVEPKLLLVNEVNLHNPETSAPLKIVFFGDTHLGQYAGEDKLNRIVDKINAQNPDLVIFTGDLIDGNSEFVTDPQMVASVLSKIRAPYGKYAAIGNHEYAMEKKYDYASLMTQAGFTLLINDWQDIPDINVRILGQDDLFMGNPDLDLGDNTLSGTYNILMTHEPDIVDKMDLSGVQLVVAGHTHGGQITIPFLTERILPSGGRKYIKGLYSLGSDHQTRLFVTKGTGMTKLPFRFMNVPEIVAITVNAN